MTTLIQAAILENHAARRVWQRLSNLVATYRDRTEERRLVAALSRHDPRRLRDMGFDPGAIYEAVEGTWDEVPTTRRNRK